MEGASLAARALLPIRFFFGFTFLYAGIDKILDPTFFDPNSPTSITAQLAAFARTSPVAFLIKPVEPLAVPLGILIALAEIAIGLGALSGLAFRLAAAGGVALSLLFFLTASWSTHPYYFGADLPYAFGWLALAIAGTGDLLVPRFVTELGAAVESAAPWGQRVGSSAAASGFRPPRYLDEEPSASRRIVVQTGLLAVATLAVGALALPVRILRKADTAQTADNSGDTSASASPDAGGTGTGAGSSATAAPGSTSAPGGPTSAPHATASPGVPLTGLTVATTAQVDARGAVRIRVPTSAPASLPAGDPAMIVKLKNGGYACFDTVCTHEGCRVGWDAADGVMLCPCHGAAFDPNNHAAVLQGPTNQPLLELPITIDAKTGAITLKA